jgi:pimeloyl-ACP methyl ester carboxylesterase
MERLGGMLRTRSAAAVLAACLALSACGSELPAPRTSPSPRRAGAGCEELTLGGRQVRFGANIKADLYGVIIGQGHRGVVLAHMNGGDSCQWLAYAHELAVMGYRVLTFDFAGFGVSPVAAAGLTEQVGAAARFLRGDGTGSVVLIGASMGATAILAMAPSLEGIAAVVSLSAARTYADADALRAAPQLRMPVFYAAGADESTEYVQAAQALYNATPPGTVRRLALPNSPEHGVYLVQPGIGPATFRADLVGFLTENAPPLS